MNEIPRSITASLEDDGHTVRAMKGDMWQISQIAPPLHVGTKNSFTEEELKGVFPYENLMSQISVLLDENAALKAENEALKAALPPPPE